MMALADAALELEYVIQVLAHLGHEFEYDVEFETKTHDAEKRIAEAEAYVIRHGSVEVGTDNTGAHDLCHRTTSGQHSRHIDRKVNKMRELNHLGKVHVIHVSTNDNWADIFTKPLDSVTFARHRDTILNVKAIPKDKVVEENVEGSWS